MVASNTAYDIENPEHRSAEGDFPKTCTVLKIQLSWDPQGHTSTDCDDRPVDGREIVSGSRPKGPSNKTYAMASVAPFFDPVILTRFT